MSEERKPETKPHIRITHSDSLRTIDISSNEIGELWEAVVSRKKALMEGPGLSDEANAIFEKLLRVMAGVPQEK